MFELTDTILERIIFAMEDQSKSFLVDLATGELVDKTTRATKIDQVHPTAESGQLAEQLVPPPGWESADGFKMMELYVATVRNPELKVQLSQALSQGKRVFKTFKEILTQTPGAEKSFADFKTKYMKRRIKDWLNALREANGLARLPEEPEETEDLLLADFSVSLSSLDALPFDPSELLDESLSEAGEALPASLLALEKESLHALDHGLAAYVLDEEGEPLALALGVLESHGGHALARIRFVYVRSGYRRLGLASLLIQALVDRFCMLHVNSVYLDSLLLPVDFQDQLLTLGFSPTGVHCAAQTE
ncbi:MAG: GNAT family N-acetyltransferase [Rectinema sp.]